ncbi:hypothetical protein KCP76_08635 [Salmonella enterica subsp. enterica serovar Weltevreden]|nr:hypothetical protein KCP76_08635 [Salmonella enterica subsp. enterica serovar Weltevreden]
MSRTSRTAVVIALPRCRATLQLMNHRRGGDFLIRLTRLGARLRKKKPDA